MVSPPAGDPTTRSTRREAGGFTPGRLPRAVPALSCGRVTRWIPHAPVLAVLLGTLACSSTPTDETPSGALGLFLRAMDRSDWDDDALRRAYGLLDSDARQGLEERAELANSLSGRDFEPWEMLAQGRYRLRFSPRRGDGMREEINGDRATVVVVGERAGQRAEVRMVREEGGWRVALELPPMRGAPEP